VQMLEHLQCLSVLAGTFLLFYYMISDFVYLCRRIKIDRLI